MIREDVWRRMLTAGAVIVFGVAVVLMLLVIPAVKGDTSPQATPENAVRGFWINVVIDLLVASRMMIAARGRRRNERAERLLLGAAGAVTLLLGVALLDAAAAFGEHVSAMRGAATALYACVAGDVIAGAIALSAAIARQRNVTS